MRTIGAIFVDSYRLCVKVSCVLCCLLLFFCSPVYAAPQESGEAFSQEEQGAEKIHVTVSIFENVGHSYLAGPLTLQCPADATPVSVLELLCGYAYLDEASLQSGVLSAITVNGDRYSAEGSGRGWLLTHNGEQLDSALGADLTLQDGDTLEWIYQVEGGTPATADNGYAIRGTAASSNESFWENEYNNLLTRACSWLKANSKDASALYTLGSAGVSVDHKYLTSVLKQITESGSKDAETLAENILAVSFCGISAEHISNRNLLSELADCPDVGRLEAALALAAADCNSYALPEGSTNDRSALLNVILAAQNENGSISPSRSAEGTAAATALALTALSPYCDDQMVRSAVDRGIDFLAAQLDPVTGGYLDPETGALSCSTTSSVVIALSSLGIQLDDERFYSGGQNLLQLIMTFQQDQGGFSEAPGGEEDVRTTEAAILAMVAQKSGRSPYLLRSPITGEGTPLFTQSETTQQPASHEVSDVEAEPVNSVSFLFGAAGLAIGILLGAAVLFLVVRMMKKADQEK